jgi:hypothetical protein
MKEYRKDNLPPEETLKQVNELTIRVKKLRDLSHGIWVTKGQRSTVGKQAATVERLADVLWRETLVLRSLLTEIERKGGS